MKAKGLPRSVAPDPAALKSLWEKTQLLLDNVDAVVHGFNTGLYVYGAGGIGKSFTVVERLKQVEANYTLYNSRMTAKGLFRALANAPDAIHLLEDMERLPNDRDAQGVLRSALWAQPGHDRVVTWTTDRGGEERFSFRGGIIILANRPLANHPELQALATRIIVQKLDVTDAEMAAAIRDRATEGFLRDGKRLLDAAECVLVAEHLIRECRSAGCPLDLRLFGNCCMAYHQWETDRTRCGWQDIVSARVRDAAHHFRQEVSGLSFEERQEQFRQVVREVVRQTDDVEEQVHLYHERTGRSRADFFRRKRDVQSGGPEVSDSVA